MKRKLFDDLLLYSETHTVIDDFFCSDLAYKYKWKFKDLLEIYTLSDVPSKSYYFKEFYTLLLDSFPKYKGDSLTLYRGTNLESINRHGAIGHIWTVDLELARLFADLSCSPRYNFLRCHGEHPVILKGDFDKSYIAYRHKNDRDEDEVFIDCFNHYITSDDVDLEYIYC